MKPAGVVLGLSMLALVASPAFADRGGNGNHYGWYKGPKPGWFGGSTPHKTPEIDPGMARSGLILLVGGVLALTGRRRRS